MTQTLRLRLFRFAGIASFVAGTAGLASLGLVSSAEGGTIGPGSAGLERAIAEQRALVVSRPQDATVQDDLGHLLSMQGDLAGAEAAYREAIALDPAAAAPHFHLGVLLERAEKSRAALKEYKNAIELDPKHAWALYEAGSIYDRWRIDSRAKRYYGEALMLDPTLSDPLVNPHILENRLATQAMIYGYRKYSKEISAPKEFHEPARIAALMIDTPAAAPVDTLAEEQEPASPANGAGGYARLSTTGSDRGGETSEAKIDENEKPEPSRVLSPRDLDAGSATNQVSGGAAGAVVGSSSKGATDPTSARAKAREARGSAARPAAAPKSGSGSSIGPARPKSGGNDSGGGSSAPFVPSPESTGRLEVTLEPVKDS